MTSKKNKAKQAKSPPSSTKDKSSKQIPAPATDAPEPLPLPEDTPDAGEPLPLPEDIPDTPELEADETQPTEVLFGLLYEAWIAHRFGPCFHWMTRTFGHHRVGDRYDTNKIFDQLDILGGGDHGKLLEELQAFRDTCFEDLAARLADRGKNA
jgi:hypothetical protein